VSGFGLVMLSAVSHFNKKGFIYQVRNYGRTDRKNCCDHFYNHSSLCGVLLAERACQKTERVIYILYIIHFLRPKSHDSKDVDLSIHFK